MGSFQTLLGRFLEAGGFIIKYKRRRIYNQIQKEAQLDKRIEIRTPLIIMRRHKGLAL